MRKPATLVLADGATFEGWSAGADVGVVAGEFVFNTALCGYQEVITDPSYAGQVVAFTYPHLGNYGVAGADDESARPWCAGVVAREISDRPSSHRAEGSLEEWLARHGVGAITGVDTRRLTRHLRAAGALPGAFGPGGPDDVAAAARAALGTDGRDLVRDVTTAEPYSLGAGETHVVVLDYGVKRSSLDQLARRHRVTVVPAGSSAADVLALAPDGVMLSNGPGDPSALSAQVAVIADLVGATPVFGICLGHQLLATALGARTYKLPFGHHGANHPVQDLATGRVEITSQNHNYAVDAAGLASGAVSHVNLYDGVVEGIDYSAERCFSVQYHPEAGPGPHDARYLFDRFAALVGAPA